MQPPPLQKKTKKKPVRNQLKKALKTTEIVTCTRYIQKVMSLVKNYYCRHF